MEAYRGDFAVDKRDPIYLYHPYHTKVPPGVIAALVEHYTRAGEVVLDVFGGSGMAGVAAAATGRLGIVCDLSPLATFAASINTAPQPAAAIEAAMRAMLRASRAELGWGFRTEDGTEVDYFVRTDVFTCPRCGAEFPFFPHGVVHHRGKVETRKKFPCPACSATLDVRSVRRVLEDGRKKVGLGWVKAGRRVSRPPDRFELEAWRRAETAPIRDWYPTEVIDPRGYSARLAQLGAKGISDVSRLLSPRNLRIFADLWQRVGRSHPRLRPGLRSLLTSSFTVISERQGYFGGGGGMSGNLYMPIVRMERNPWKCIERKLNRFRTAEAAKSGWTGRTMVSTQSATDLRNLPDESVHYIYTDPPFGGNIIYSELNRVLEAWMGLSTATAEEAVVDPSRGRLEPEYAELLGRAFGECYRVLQPGRWITVEFHNTKASIWKIIQTALVAAGFRIEQVGMLDKGSNTILADIRPSAAKHDLLISARKPAAQETPAPVATSHIQVETFVRWRLAQLPQPTESQPRVAERRPHVLHSRFIAHHVERGLEVPVSAAHFLRRVRDGFVERDGMLFDEARPPG